MRSFLVLVSLLATISFSSADFESDWAQFRVDYGRQYKSIEEESFRKELFRKTWEMVQEHNKKFERGEVSWKMGINKFADMTEEEKRQHMGILPHENDMDSLPLEVLYSGSNFESDWKNFKNKFERIYESAEEESYRKGIFIKNWERINEHNKKFEKGEVSWKMGVNNYTDFTQEEFGKRNLGIPPKFSAIELKADWENFQITYGRNYENSIEAAFRKGIFHYNWEIIVLHNRKFQKGEVTWKMAVNNFTDFTGEEMSNRHGFRPIHLDLDESNDI